MGNKRTGSGKKKKTRLIRGLDNDVVLDALRELAENMNIDVRFEKGDFQTGSCRVESKRMIIIKKNDSEHHQIDNFIKELLYFKPTITSLHEDIQKRIETLESELSVKED